MNSLGCSQFPTCKLCFAGRVCQHSLAFGYVHDGFSELLRNQQTTSEKMELLNIDQNIPKLCLQTRIFGACIFVRFCLQVPLFFLDGTMSMSEGKYSAWKYLWTFRWQQLWLLTIPANHESSSTLSNSHVMLKFYQLIYKHRTQQRMARIVSCGSRQRCHRTLRMWCVWTAWTQVQQSVTSKSKMTSKRNKHI